MAKVVKELLAVTPNRVGMLAEVSGAMAENGVNITAICAYGMGGKAYFMMLTDNNRKAVKALKARRFKVSERDVVAVELANKVGMAERLANKLARAGVSLDRCYGSTGNGTKALLVFSTKSLKKALAALK
jgi:hypothetical protein